MMTRIINGVAFVEDMSKSGDCVVCGRWFYGGFTNGWCRGCYWREKENAEMIAEPRNCRLCNDEIWHYWEWSNNEHAKCRQVANQNAFTSGDVGNVARCLDCNVILTFDDICDENNRCWFCRRETDSVFYDYCYDCTDDDDECHQTCNEPNNALARQNELGDVAYLNELRRNAGMYTDDKPLTVVVPFRVLNSIV